MTKNIRKNKLKEGEIIPIRYDFVFTNIFNNEDNMDIIEGFIASYFDLSLEEVHNKIKIKSRNLKIENKKEQDNKVDLLLELEDEEINIEISNEMTQGLVERNIVYLTKVHSKNLKYADIDYMKINKSIQINLDYNRIGYVLGNKFMESYYIMNDEKEKLTEKLQIDYINIVKAKEIVYNISEREKEIRKWCRVLLSKSKKELDNNLKEIKKMSDKSKEKLSKIVEDMSEDEDIIDMYIEKGRAQREHNTIIAEARIAKQEAKEAKEEALKAKEKGLQEGIKEGIKENKMKIAKELLKNEQLTIDYISSVTDLSIEELEKIKKDND